MSYKSASRNDKNPENVKRKTNILSLITVLLCFAVILSIALAMLVFYRPEFDNNIPFDTDPASSLDSNEDNDKQKSEIANFLILGCDRSGGLNTDVIIIASFNIGKGTVNMVQIPRDTYVNAGTSSRKINSLYASFYVRAKNAKVKDAHAKAVYDLIAVIEPNLCVKIHHYITMDLKGFANIVDAIGGVDIVLPDDLYYHDSTPGHELIIDLKAGPQTLDGKAAEQFVRFRMGYKMADIARMDAQKLFIAAFIKKLKNNVNITTIFPLAEQVIKNVRTDMSVADCVYYAKKALSVDMSRISMMTLPGAGQTSEAGTAFYVMHRSAALKMINKYLNIYDLLISDSIFDKNIVFCNLNDNNLKSQYYKDVDWDKVVTADEPEIDIPLLGE